MNCLTTELMPNNGIGAVSLVGQHELERKPLQQCSPLGTIDLIPSCYQESNRHTMFIYRCVKLGVNTSFGPPCILCPARNSHAILVNLDMTGINHNPFKIWAASEKFCQSGPKAGFGKSAKSHKNTIPVSIVWRKITQGAPERISHRTALKKRLLSPQGGHACHRCQGIRVQF